MTGARRATRLLALSVVAAVVASVGAVLAPAAVSVTSTAAGAVAANVADRIDSQPVALTPAGPDASTPTVNTPSGTGPAFSEDQPIAAQQDALTAQAGEAGRLHASAQGIAPFTLIGISAVTPDGQPALVRVHQAKGWSDWSPLQFGGQDAPDPSSPEGTATGATGATPTSEGVWFGTADGYELSLPAGSSDLTVHLAREYAPQVSTPQSEPGNPPNMAQAVGARPPINPRSAWGARPPKEPYAYADRVTHAIVHHSVTQNVYSPADVPSILRSIQAYHMDANGWNDIAYNFAVDKYGNIWEARGGGITSTVIGGHTYGANTGTTGVVALGDFSTVGAPQAMVNSIGDLLGWKLAIHGVEPLATTPYTIKASDRYAEGQVVNFPSIIGHRDVNYTGCPGDYLYPRLGEIRLRAEAKWQQMTFLVLKSNTLVGGFADSAAQYQLSPGIRLSCDWNGDGIDTPATFRAGMWYLTDSSTGGTETRAFGYGNPDDIPVCGDWNGDGIDTPGVFRHGVWCLTNTIGSPFADIVFVYGNPDDTQLLVGDWNGDGIDTPGLFRSGIWALTNSLRTGFADIVIAYGNPDDRPVVGDWNHDGIDTPGVFRHGIWCLTNALRTGVADTVFAYGNPDDSQVFAGDWNGNGVDTPAVVRFP